MDKRIIECQQINVVIQQMQLDILRDIVELENVVMEAASFPVGYIDELIKNYRG